MGYLLQRFFSFDRLIGPRLVKIVFYFGAAIIALVLAGALLSGLFAVVGGNFGQGLMQFLAAPVVAAVAFVYWRFVCELFMLGFLAYERMGEIRDLLGGAPPPAPDPNHPQF
jgi:hypothetical protein